MKRDEIYECIRTGIPTIVRTTTVAAAYFESRALGRSISEKEVYAIARDKDKLRTTLSRLAFLNIKKHSGNAAKSTDREIRAESVANAPLLRQQIEAHSQNIIIAGGNVCWNSLRFDIGLFPNIDLLQKPRCVRSGSANAIVEPTNQSPEAGESKPNHGKPAGPLRTSSAA